MPTPPSVHVDDALTQVVIRRQRQRFIAERIFPVIIVQKQTGKVFNYDSEGEAFRPTDDVRAPGAEAKLTDFKVDTDTTYDCKNHAQGVMVPDEELANADAPIRPFLERTEFLDDKIQLVKEINCVAALVAGLTSTLTSTPTNKWNNYSDGDPIADLKSKLLAVKLASGSTPNTVAMDALVLNAISEHPDFIDRCKHTFSPVEIAKMGNAGLLGSLLTMMPEDPVTVIVSDSIASNAAVKGQTASFARVWDEYVLVCRVEAPRIGTSVLGVHFRWQGLEGSNGTGRRVRRWREERRTGDMIQVEEYYDQKLLKAAAGHLFYNTLT